jgi:AAHS family benzoate transporter-like MFS transporter
MIATDRPLRSPGAVVAACGLVVLLEGYDQSVYGAVLPVLVKDASWNLSRANAAYVGSAAFVGMFVGAIVASRLAARISRRTVLLTCVTVFGVCGTACWAAQDGWTLAALRALTGLGLGGVLPVTSTLAFAAVGDRRRMLAYAAMFATIPLGGSSRRPSAKW